MNNTKYEVNGYLFTVSAKQIENGKWRPFAYFELKADFDNQKELIQGVQHLIAAQFDNETEALQAAYEFALAHANSGITGL